MCVGEATGGGRREQTTEEETETKVVHVRLVPLPNTLTAYKCGIG